MNNYRYIFAPQAEENLEDIADYLANNLHSSQAAKNFLLDFSEKLKEICKMPTMCKLCNHTPFAEKGIHYALIKKYKIYYQIDESNQLINILFVKHTSQNEENFL